MRYVSLFSGIEAASAAWAPLGWEPVAFSEIDPYACKVLERHYPDVPNVGDICEADWSGFAGDVDLVVGGSPCQSFSLAGLQRALDDPRGRLMFEYVRAVDELRPRFCLWENVSNVLRVDDGAPFRQLLSELDRLGYAVAYRVLRADYFGVPQARRRVFLLGALGDPETCADVLLGDNVLSPTERPEYPEPAAGSNLPSPFTISSFDSHGMKSDNPRSGYRRSVTSKTLDTTCCNPGCNQGGMVIVDSPATSCGTIAPRRLTHIECERLQGFDDEWTSVDGARADAPRYACIGNSIAVPVLRYIGERLDSAVRDLAQADHI